MMKKQVNELWIWPPGASGNFVMTHHYGTGEAKPNNEYQVRGPVKWIPMFFNKIHAHHYLKIGHSDIRILPIVIEIIDETTDTDGWFDFQEFIKLISIN